MRGEFVSVTRLRVMAHYHSICINKLFKNNEKDYCFHCSKASERTQRCRSALRAVLFTVS